MVISAAARHATAARDATAGAHIATAPCARPTRPLLLLLAGPWTAPTTAPRLRRHLVQSILQHMPRQVLLIRERAPSARQWLCAAVATAIRATAFTAAAAAATATAAGGGARGGGVVGAAGGRGAAAGWLAIA